jgi:N utilization substance protein B
VLYAADLSATDQGGPDPRDVFEGVATHFDLQAGARAFAEELALGVTAHRAELDERIAAHARNWRVDRMAAVDRNVLRLAAYELLHTETPASVVLDEAIELARDFGSERSPAFVNGVLDAIARERPGADTGAVVQRSEG